MQQVQLNTQLQTEMVTQFKQLHAEINTQLERKQEELTARLEKQQAELTAHFQQQLAERLAEQRRFIHCKMKHRSNFSLSFNKSSLCSPPGDLLHTN